ncbi:NADH:ubiquinone oxidoreductase 11.6kD subunit like protein [Zymoseptoria brevis]|uniref:NADH dehydrogenase [ubiquinone] 1 beta subcomplex subunit 11, mitochondrial n=1 Tax=Zymoseptoria brevis TaxID=1047168 RepID=A0A0F4GUU0_9PEZI|nr:NADH:ubiquinone oxidoreductase 11.6kD subunit like protein [Zymoseptoria brevis]
MSLLRSRLIISSRARFQIVPNLAARPQQRLLSSTAARSAGDHAHEDHYDPPGGWLFGVKPGEKYENEGWENVWFYGFFGSLLFGVVGYCYKPDTSIQTWALEEARRRLEAEGILEDPDKKR